MQTDKDAKQAVNEIPREGMNKFRYEVAEEIGLPIRPLSGGGYGYGERGYTSGYLVQKMIEAQERQMQNQGK